MNSQNAAEISRGHAIPQTTCSLHDFCLSQTYFTFKNTRLSKEPQRIQSDFDELHLQASTDGRKKGLLKRQLNNSKRKSLRQYG